MRCLLSRATVSSPAAVACQLLLLAVAPAASAAVAGAGHGDAGSGGRRPPLDAPGVPPVQTWPLEGEDDACAGSGAEGGPEECALSLRQLRGRARASKAGAHRGGTEAGSLPAERIAGVPVYLHPVEADPAGEDLRAGILPEPEHGTQHRPQAWIVNFEGADAANGDLKVSSASQDAVIVKGGKEELERELQAQSSVLFVEEDAVLRMVPEFDVGEELEPSPQLAASEKGGEDEGTPEPPASWGLDRIDEREGLDHWYETAGYGGGGAHVYVLDTGIRSTHEDFRGRAVPTLEVDNDGIRRCASDNTSCALDMAGHGTHTAGTAGGHLYGVAKAATLHACKTLDNRGVGMISWMVQALDWVGQEGERPAVVSASLGGRYDSPSLTRSIERAVAAGVTVVVAAGNENDDACGYMPSKVPSAITVAATAIGDARAPYSNFGKCVDVFAPGSGITSAGFQSDTGLATMSGTSMACPHVAGAVALLLAEDHSRTPADIERLLLAHATVGEVSDTNGSPDLLLYTEPPKPRPEPARSPPRFEVYDGPCQVDAGGCITSSGFPDHGYGNSEHCDILVHGDVGHVHVEAFDTEQSFDFLVANFKQYSGLFSQKGRVPSLECVNPIGGILWSSDRTTTASGWKICPELPPPKDAATPGFHVACGTCTTDAVGCVMSPNYPGNYSDRSTCYINAVGDVASIHVEAFSTEAIFDALFVNGRNFSGTVGPEGLRPTQQLVWSSDMDTVESGWKLCPSSSPESGA